MHPNPIYHSETTARNLEFAAERGFGTLMANGDPAPLVAQIPFTLDGAAASAELHLMRSNPLARACATPLPARIVVYGPDSYVSPDWYEIDDQVPTWNYVAVHLIGVLEPLPDAALAGVLDRLSANFEERLLPKTPWTAGKMDSDIRTRFMRMIQPFRFAISRVEGTWKLGQNKTPEVRRAAASRMKAYGIGADAKLLAAMMLGVR